MNKSFLLVKVCYFLKVLQSLSDVAIEGISGGVDTAECGKLAFYIYL